MFAQRPGSSSRSTTQQFRQFPQRDEATMSDGIQAGFSNSEPVADAPQDVRPEVQEPESQEPGYSNGKAIRNDTAEAKVVKQESSEDKAVKKTSKKAKG